MFDTEPKAPDLRLLRMRDVTELTNLSESTIRRLMKKSEFPKPIRMGSSILFKKAEVDALVDRLGGAR